MKHLSEEDLVLLYYNEPGAPREASVHLTDCADCRAAAESLARTLDACDEWTVPETGAQFRRNVWARLVPQLDRRQAPDVRLWLAAAAIAAMVIAAFFMGRTSSKPAPAFTAGLSPHARERILAISLADHLERAQLLLTEIANMDDSDTSRIAADRARARDLVNEDRLMRQVFTSDRENARMLPLLDDVGRFVLEVANAPDRMEPVEVRDLKRRLDSESLLFKVRIIEANLRNSSVTGKMS